MPAEEGFVGALPEDDEDVPLEEPAMVNEGSDLQCYVGF